METKVKVETTMRTCKTYRILDKTFGKVNDGVEENTYLQLNKYIQNKTH